MTYSRIISVIISSCLVSTAMPYANDNDLKLVSAVNASFGFDLFRQLAKENPGKNLFFSPYSMLSALAMAVEGARGETADQMGKTLCFPESIRRIGGDAMLIPWNTALIHSGMSALNARFKTKVAPQELRDKITAIRDELAASERKRGAFHAAHQWDLYHQQSETSMRLADQMSVTLAQVDQYELRVASALYGQESYPFQQTYLDTINRSYGTGIVVPVDFINGSESIREQINSWVRKGTNQRINNLIAHGGVDKYTRLLLINAIYFKGEWAMPFDQSITRQDVFFTRKNHKAPIAMMHNNELNGGRYGAFNADGSHFQTPSKIPSRNKPDSKALYPGKDGFLIAEFPYKGKELSMVLIVPLDVDGLHDLETKITSVNFQSWIDKIQNREINVYLPKFKLESDYQDMKKTLRAMGMARPFIDPRNPTGAQFDAMCSSTDPDLKLYISNVVHKAFLEVNEKGTEAAAATAISIAIPVSAPSDEPFTPTFRVDKPFLFAIRDVKTGMILFLGRMADPGNNLEDNQ